MITLAELKRNAAKNSVALTVVEKDYALTWLLYALTQSRFKNYFIFKGGTALRKIYFSEWRYSEDLDFTVTKSYSKEELMEVVNTMNTFLKENISMPISAKSIHLNPYYAQLKIQFLGPLNHENTIKVDLSFDELLVLKPKKRKILSEYTDQEKHLLAVYPLEELLAEKIRSILQRGKTRDYYDVWQLLRFHADKINKIKTKEVLFKKCKHKNVICNEQLLFEKNKVNEAKLHWEKGLTHQMRDLPHFDTISLELRDLLQVFLKQDH